MGKAGRGQGQRESLIYVSLLIRLGRGGGANGWMILML